MKPNFQKNPMPYVHALKRRTVHTHTSPKASPLPIPFFCSLCCIFLPFSILTFPLSLAFFSPPFWLLTSSLRHSHCSLHLLSHLLSRTWLLRLLPLCLLYYSLPLATHFLISFPLALYPTLTLFSH